MGLDQRVYLSLFHVHLNKIRIHGQTTFKRYAIYTKRPAESCTLSEPFCSLKVSSRGISRSNMSLPAILLINGTGFWPIC